MTLIDWINQHDCGVSPTALPVALVPGAIEIRVLCQHADGSTSVQSDFVNSYTEARDVLGY